MVQKTCYFNRSHGADHCTIFLPPYPYSLGDMKMFWVGHHLKLKASLPAQGESRILLMEVRVLKKVKKWNVRISMREIFVPCPLIDCTTPLQG